jgi:hypothetical protein
MGIKPKHYPYGRLSILAFIILSLAIAGKFVNAESEDITQSADEVDALDVSHTVATTDTTCCEEGGDANHDGSFNLGDPVFIINYVFKGGPAPLCMREADLNNDCDVNVADAVYGISCVFKDCLGGPLCGPTHCEY